MSDNVIKIIGFAELEQIPAPTIADVGKARMYLNSGNSAITTDNPLSSPDSGSNGERFGAGSTAAGVNTAAFGRFAQATGDWTIAVGYGAVATGNESIAVGQGATTGIYGTALGFLASASAGIAIGKDAASTGNDFVAGSSTVPAQHVYFGSGHFGATGFTLHAAQSLNTGVPGGDITIAPGIGNTGDTTSAGGSLYIQTQLNGNTSPTTRLQVSPDGGVTVGAATGGSQGPGTVNASGFYINGSSLGTYPIAPSTGTASVLNGGFAVGSSALAQGTNALAIGPSSTANGIQSVAVGYGSNVTQNYSTALGYSSNPGGTNTVVIGWQAYGGNGDTVAVGYNAQSADGGVAIGSGAAVSNNGVVAIGWNVIANQVHNVCIGGYGLGNNMTVIGATAGGSVGGPFNDCICIGVGTLSAANTFSAGSSTSVMSSVVFGDGPGGTATYSLIGTTSGTAVTVNASGTVAFPSGVSSYKGVSTTGLGIPAIYGSGRSATQTAAVASVVAHTVGAADGSFLVSANVNVTSYTAGTFTTTVAYTDETGTPQTVTLNFSTTAGVLGTTIAAGPFEGVPLRIRAQTATSIVVATTGTFTTLTYNVEADITQVA